MAQIFVSHSNTDNDVAEQLKTWLNSIGFANVFLDFDKHSGFGVGVNWERQLYKEIETSEAVLLVLTPAWLESKWCFAEFTQARALGKAIFPVIMSPIGERFIASDIQSVDITKEGEGGFEKLARSLTEAALSGPGRFSWDKHRPPYPGLLSFEEEDAAVFFGRNDEIRRIIERLNLRRAHGGQRIVVLLAASGSGKSSLLRAGLIPRLKRDPANWCVLAPMRPRLHPFDEFAKSLAIGLKLPSDWVAICQRLRGPEPARTLAAFVQDLQVKNASPNATVLLCLDQAEELFTISDKDEAKLFLELVGAAVRAGLPLVVLLVMRSDCLDHLQRADSLKVAFDEVSLKPLPIVRINEIIRGPAAVAGLTVEEELVTAATRDAQTSDSLPLLAFALRELHDKHANNRTLTLAAYRDLGEPKYDLTPLENAVRRAADDAIASALPSEDELDQLRRAFIPALVRVNEEGEYARRPAAMDSLPASSRRLIDALVSARLLIARRDGAENVIEVAHEALFRKWPTLRGWLDQEREFLVGKAQLEHSLRDWKTQSGKNRRDALLHGLQLNRARVWLAAHGPSLSAEERQFINDSIKAAESDFRRRAIVKQSLAWVSAAAVAALALFVLQWRHAEENRMLSEHNFGLALLQESEDAMKREMPARAVAAASVAIGTDSEAKRRRTKTLLMPGSTEFLRAQTIAAIGGKSASFPRWQMLETGGAHAVAWSHRGDLIAFAGQTLAISVATSGAPTVLSRLVGHTNRINSVKFSPDDRLIASGGEDNAVSIWDVAKDSVSMLCGHSGPVREVDFHPSGKWLASASKDRSVIVWDVATRQQIISFSDSQVWSQSVRFSRDGRLLVYTDKRGHVFVRDTSDWSLLGKLELPEENIVSMDIRPDGTSLVAASFDGPIFVIDLLAMKLRATLPGHGDKLWKIRYAPDGAKFASASWDGSARFWNAESFEPLTAYDAHDHWIVDIALSPDGSEIATAAQDGAVRIFNADTAGLFVVKKDHKQEVLRAAFSRDGSMFATAGADNRVLLYRVDSKRRLERACPTIELRDWGWGLAFNSDGSLLVSAGTAAGYDANVIGVTDTATCAPIRDIPIGKMSIISLKLSADDRFLAASSLDGTVKIWNFADGTERAVLREHTKGVIDVAFDPTGEYLASAGRDRKVIVWNVSTGAIKMQLQDFSGPVWRVVFSPDGSTLATAGGERTVRLWDWQSGKQRSIAVTTPTSIAGLLYTPDNRFLIVGDDNRSITIWDTTSWTPTAMLAAQIGVRGPLAVHPNVDLLAFDGEKGAIRLWDLDRQPIAPSMMRGFTLDGTKVKFLSPAPPSPSLDQSQAGELARSPKETTLNAACP